MGMGDCPLEPQPNDSLHPSSSLGPLHPWPPDCPAPSLGSGLTLAHLHGSLAAQAHTSTLGVLAVSADTVRLDGRVPSRAFAGAFRQPLVLVPVWACRTWSYRVVLPWDSATFVNERRHR